MCKKYLFIIILIYYASVAKGNLDNIIRIYVLYYALFARDNLYYVTCFTNNNI